MLVNYVKQIYRLKTNAIKEANIQFILNKYHNLLRCHISAWHNFNISLSNTSYKTQRNIQTLY